MKISDIPKLKTGDLLDSGDEYWIFLYSEARDEFITAFRIGHSWAHRSSATRHYILYNDAEHLVIAGLNIVSIDHLMLKKDKQKLFAHMYPALSRKIKRYAILEYFKHMANK